MASMGDFNLDDPSDPLAKLLEAHLLLNREGSNAICGSEVFKDPAKVKLMLSIEGCSDEAIEAVDYIIDGYYKDKEELQKEFSDGVKEDC